MEVGNQFWATVCLVGFVCWMLFANEARIEGRRLSYFIYLTLAILSAWRTVVFLG